MSTTRAANIKSSNSLSDASSPHSHSNHNEKKQPKDSNNSNEEELEETKEEAAKAATKDLGDQISKKRSSNASSTSSVSSSIQSSLEPASVKDTIKKLEPTITLDTDKLATSKLSLKTRHSDSVSSICSTYSLKRSSVDEPPSGLSSQSSKAKEEPKLEEEKSLVPNETKDKESTELTLNSILSIKDEIMDFEPSPLVSHGTLTTTSDPSACVPSLSEAKKETASKPDDNETGVKVKAASKVTLKRNSNKAALKKEEEKAASEELPKKLDDEKPVEISSSIQYVPEDGKKENVTTSSNSDVKKPEGNDNCCIFIYIKKHNKLCPPHSNRFQVVSGG